MALPIPRSLPLLALLAALVPLHAAAEVPGGDRAAGSVLELRIYRITDSDKQPAVSDYLEHAYVPALHRLGIEHVGVFSTDDPKKDPSLFVLIEYPDLDSVLGLRDALAADDDFQQAAGAYFDRPLSDPAFVRIESRLLKPFDGMPHLEVPDVSRKKVSRLFELRLYQSHTEDHARRKIDMFNSGEIQLMRDVQLGPVFFGEMLIGPGGPCLVYMLSAEDAQQHQQHWKAFLAHPTWDKLKNMSQYKDTVSHIENWFLVPTPYSDL